MYTIITENSVGIIANTKLCNPMVSILCAKSSILPKFIPMIKIIKATAINCTLLFKFTKCERKAPKFIYGDISSLKNNDSISLFFIVLYF